MLLHHATDVLPALGLFALAVFLAEYQVLFLELGIASNFVGTTFMMGTLQKHRMVLEESRLRRLFFTDWEVLFRISAVFSILLLAVWILELFVWKG